VKSVRTFGTYHEPFLGGGALFFELRAQRMLKGRVVLSDVNAKLIETYQAVADEPGQVIALLREHETLHSPEHYYATRATVPATAVERSARFIYLNRTCFNGLYRENRKGEFNVPIGSYVRPVICDEPVLLAASEALRGVELKAKPFEDTCADAQPGDLVYFDPPYIPDANCTAFTSYTMDGFSWHDQITLGAVVDDLSAKGVFVLASNSYSKATVDIYAGYRIQKVRAKRSVNCRGNQRGEVDEVIIANWEPAPTAPQPILRWEFAVNELARSATQGA